MTQPQTYPKFITTTPIGEDLFESGSQKKIAGSIARHIQRTPSEYRLIGLDGSWGTGKSNVISIIKKQLKGTHHVFIYDAWSHQEDLQRRSFLEEFTADLAEHNVLDRGKWDTKLKDLLAKRKVTITKTIPKISVAYYFILVATFLIPVTKIIADDFQDIAVWIKILITLSPLLLLLISWAIAACKYPKYRKLDTLLAIYKEKDLHREIDETISEKEPSVKEFRNWMYDLVQDLVKEVIIVFDNMDRLPAEKVKSLWSSIHTFFSERSYAKLWVIIPFDRIHISEAFEKDNITKTNHFINKTFSVIFTVSPVVLTEWWEFFNIKYQEAFGHAEADEYNIVKSLFDRYQTDITPRKIISFINELVSLKLLWESDMRLRFMALYLLHREDLLKNPIRVILSIGQDQRSKVLFREEDNVPDHIAALVYNIPVKIASQVTLQREMIVAIRDKDVDKLKTLYQHRDFFHILEEIFDREEMDIEPSVFAIQAIEHFEGADQQESLINRIWHVMAGRQLSIPIDTVLFTDVHQSLLLKSSATSVKPLVRHYVYEFHNSRNFKGAAYFSALEAIGEFIQQHRLNIQFNTLIPAKQMNTLDFIEYVQLSKKDYDKYPVNTDKGALETQLLVGIPDDWKGCDIVPFIREAYSFPNIQKKIEEMIVSNMVTIENVVQIFNLYKAVSVVRPFAVALLDATLQNLLENAVGNSEAYYELSAMRLGRMDTFPVYSGNGEAILLLTDEAFISQVAQRVEYYVNYGDLLLKSTNWNKPLLVAVAKALTLKSAGISQLTIAAILPKFATIADAIDVTDAELFNRLNRWSSKLEKVITAATVPAVFAEFRIYAAAVAENNSLSEIIIKKSTEYIEAIESAEWTDAFSDEASYTFRLLCFLLTKKVIKHIPDKAVEPYKQSLDDKANINMKPNTFNVIEWGTIYECTDKRHLKSTIKNIRDLFLHKVDITAPGFIFFEQLLRKQGDLAEQKADVIRKMLVPVINDADCRKLIAQHFDFYLPIIMEAGDEKLDFITRWRGLAEWAPDNDIQAISIQINKSLASKVHLQSARYFTDEHSMDVTYNLRQKIQTDAMLHFKITNVAVGGDPHAGVAKKLEITYTYEATNYSKTFLEDEWFHIP